MFAAGSHSARQNEMHATQMCQLVAVQFVDAPCFQQRALLPAYANIKIPRLQPELVCAEKARALLETSPEGGWSSMSPEECLEKFRLVSLYVRQKEKEEKEEEDHVQYHYEHMLQALATTLLPRLDQPQMEHLLQSLQMWQQRLRLREAPLERFLSALDEELVSRHKSWNTVEKLRACELIMKLGRAKKSTCFWLTMKSIKNKLQQLSMPELVHFVSLVNMHTSIPVNMYEVEYHCDKYMRDMSIYEIATVALCFFKKRTQARSPEFFKLVCDKALENVHQMGSFEFAAIMKFCRYAHIFFFLSCTNFF